MGVPKFFKFISERYPCLSELVKEYQIPEFDNLYLDMNGIIHMCSHPDDFDPHFRISEEKIFQDIFHYIEVLFCLIKPQRLFFMAIDGVAPRAKMNQQRGRRFRSAKDAELLEARARAKGEALPTEARFDSNCITPGTVFMARLQEQLKYFVTNKISTDSLWRKCKVILSGHETPGEGEHKIMDYIRYIRAQPGYDPNTRHCLYGLDADLIMLGLCTHEPHFSLLREEVRFGKKSNKRKSVPEQITFFLLHLSLMREYLELEFLPLKDTLPFNYDMESIIDDWVLMGFLVGNDFIPHLPNLHIANGALPILYNVYMKVLPTLDGYINEGGKLNLDRFEKFMEALAEVDVDHFSAEFADLKYFEAKTGRKFSSKPTKRKELEVWNEEETNEPPMNKDLAALIKKTDDMLLEPSVSNLESLALNDFEGEGDAESSRTVSDSDNEDYMFNMEFKQHKTDYYMTKLEYAQVTPEVLRSQAEGYVRAIQWNLNYYYNGVCSWSWYYPHHYAPYISDIKGFANFKLEFDMGTPFKPYEQLLAVLPAASKELLPVHYHELMTGENSPIKDYYPMDFRTDLNGKKQEWEAVVLIPFISENLLLEAMEPCNKKLSLEEIKRNTHGPMLVYEYVPDDLGEYLAPEYFPPVKPNHAKLVCLSREDIRVPLDKLIKGAYPGVKMDVYYPGFPTLKHLKYESHSEKGKVRVFDQPSRGDNIIIFVTPPSETPSIETISRELCGKTVFVAWPHLVEALVVGVSDKNYRYEKASSTPGSYNVVENKGNLLQLWQSEKAGITNHYRERLGIEVGETQILVHVKQMVGRKYVFNRNQVGGRITFEKQWATTKSVYPYQTIVASITVFDDDYKSYQDLVDVFPIGSSCFMLSHPHYGSQGTVMDSTESVKFGRVKVSIIAEEEPDVQEFRKSVANLVSYMPGYVAATRLSIAPPLLSRLTGTILILPGSKANIIPESSSRLNVGLNLKFNKKNEEVPGYTKKEDNQWLYSEKAIELVGNYIQFAPELVQYLNSHLNRFSDLYFEEDIFKNKSGKSVKDILDWIKKQPYNSIDRKPSGSLCLEPEVVKRLEVFMDDFHDKKPSKKQIIMQVKPYLLFKSDLQMGNIAPDLEVEFQLYDRVVNVRQSHTVPYGYKGTVIGIHKPFGTAESDVTYDVLFDKPFPGGAQCNCSPNRGYTLAKPAVINISHGIREMHKKAGKPGQLIQSLQSKQQFALQQQQQHGHNAQPQPGNYSRNSAFASCPPGYNQYPPSNRPFGPPQPLHFVPPQLQQQQHPMPINSAQFHNSFMPNFNRAPSNHPQNPFSQQQPYQPAANDFNGFCTDFAKQKGKGGGGGSQGVFGPPMVSAFGGQQKKQQQQGGSPHKKVIQQPQDVKNETDILKKLLKIDETKPQTDNKSMNVQQNSTRNEVSTSISVQEIFARAAERKLKADQESSPFCSIQLLELFQKKGFGIPRYNYFTLPNAFIEAIVELPNGGHVKGIPCRSKDQASESAAKLALEKLKDEPTQMMILKQTINVPLNHNHPAIPIPPKQWRQQQNSSAPNVSSSPRANTRSAPNRQESKSAPNSSGGSSAAADKHLSPFVPLQAVKQHRSKHVRQDSNGKDKGKDEKNAAAGGNNGNASGSGGGSKKMDSPKRNSANHNAQQAKANNAVNPRPKVQRKSRIAANFAKAPKESTY